MKSKEGELVVEQVNEVYNLNDNELGIESREIIEKSESTRFLRNTGSLRRSK